MRALSAVAPWVLTAVIGAAGCGGSGDGGGGPGDEPVPPVTHGSQIDETNTGVPAGHTLADVSSTLLVTEEWIAGSNHGSRVVENLRFLSGARLIVAVDGFTVRYCQFLGTASFSTDPNDGSGRLGKNVEISDSEFDGNHENFAGDVAVFGSHLTLKRVHIHRWPRGMWVGDGGIRVEECYMHDLTLDDTEAHLENVYVAGGTDQVYVRSKLVSNGVRVAHGTAGSSGISASLAIYNESWSSFTPLRDLRVEDNYFESDGYYPVYGGACVGKGNPYATHMVVTGNRFGRGGRGGSACCFDPDAEGNEWADNAYTDGVSIPAPHPG